MQTLVERGGPVRIRLGGNTQEFAFMVDDLGDGKAVSKQKAETNNPVSRSLPWPTLDTVLHVAAQASSLYAHRRLADRDARRHIHNGLLLPHGQRILAG